MLGNTIFRFFSEKQDFDTWGTVRSQVELTKPPFTNNAKIINGVSVENDDALLKVFLKVRPDIVINCVGIVKQLETAEDPLVALPINSLLPHKLANLCSLTNARLIHFSTDCVFSGSKGMYKEGDVPDSVDIYGRSKHLGEVEYPHTVTLRTSIIGHELNSTRSLVDWFLSQKTTIRGYKNAIFSGLPTVEIARIIHNFILPATHLSGLYHVSADPISKFDLLTMVADVYEKNIRIEPDFSIIIDRSLDSSKFRSFVGYTPDPWHDLILMMKRFS